MQQVISADAAAGERQEHSARVGAWVRHGGGGKLVDFVCDVSAALTTDGGNVDVHMVHMSGPCLDH